MQNANASLHNRPATTTETPAQCSGQLIAHRLPVIMLFTATYIAAALNPMPIHITNSGSSTCITDCSHTHASLILLTQLQLLLLLLLLPLMEP
jgi:hypothetical protein